MLDLRGGLAVHARGGRRDAYAPVEAGPLLGRAGDAVGLASAYLSAHVGLRELYVADLDAVAGARPGWELLARLATLGAPLWVDAGVRSADRARDLVRLGVSRVVAGLETLESMRELAAIADALGGADRLAFSLDLRDGIPQAESSALGRATPAALAAEAAECGAGTVIVLDLARVGSGRGVDELLLRELRDVLPPECALVAGGGVRDRRDLEALAAVGCDAVLVASALLDGGLGAADVESARLFGGNAERCHES